MQVFEMPISELVMPEKNIRIHTEKQIDEYIRSLTQFEQIRPVVIDENNVILAGNGMVTALRKMGRTTATVYKMENLTENQKKKLMIADNKIFNLGIDNLDTFNSFIEDLRDDHDIPGIPEELLSSLVAESYEITEKISQYGTLDADEIAEIKETEQKKKQAETTQNVVPVETNNNPGQGNQSENDEPPRNDQKEPEQNRSYVICPKCGEKVWL